MRKLRVFKALLVHIRTGEKDLELRLKLPRFTSIAVGDQIKFVSGCSSLRVVRRVVAIREYASLEAMLDAEDPGRIAPGHDKEKLAEAAGKIWSQQQIERWGLMVIEITRP